MANYEIRLVQPEDFEWCVEVAGKQMLIDIEQEYLFDPVSMRMVVNKMFVDKTAIIAKIDKEYAGVIGGYLYPNILNPEICCITKMLWYTVPKYEDTRVRAILLREFEKMYKESPAHIVTMGLTPKAETSGVLRRYGFVRGDTSYSKKIKEI